ncbi:MAG: threonine/serine dehydratase [Bacteroidota bacterium]
MGISLSDIQHTREQLGELVLTTPVWAWRTIDKERLLGTETEIWIKLELLQRGGSFKPRGALKNMMELAPEQLQTGITAVSAGNHAIAVAYAARVLNSQAKVVMPKSANAARIAECESLGAEIILVEDVQEAFAEVKRIQEEEGRAFIHPFEGEKTVLGTATVALEYHQQVGPLDALIVPIGGGGLAAGMAAAIHLLDPTCKVYGVEPEGANTMYQSLQKGSPQSIERVRTIADSLGAPFSMPYTMDLCAKYLERVVLIDDSMIRRSMNLMFSDMKLVAEPAAAASLAALLGPLREELHGKKVGLIACGTNIDLDTFYQYVNGVDPWR